MNLLQQLTIRTGFGEILVTPTVSTTWLIMLFLLLCSLSLCKNLNLQASRTQAAVEAAICSMVNAIKAVSPEKWKMLFPFIATLWLFILAANLAGVVPGLRSPTADLSATSALSILVFLSVHWFGIRSEGIKSYLRHYLSPSPIMLPFHIISEISRTIALAVRLFGNMMSLEMTAMVVLLVAGFLVPVPLLMLHIVEAIIQAYIFGILALIYIASGIESQRRRQEENS